VQYIPVVHECKWYFNCNIYRAVFLVLLVYFPGENIAMCIMENKAQFGTFHLVWLHTTRGAHLLRAQN